jgi:Protein of unknown function (DUF3489)
MQYQLAADGSIAPLSEGASIEPGLEQQVVFGSEQEWIEVSCQWPLKRLIAIWNGLPGVVPVQKFENRLKATHRIWRALEGSHEKDAAEGHSRSSERTRTGFREGSKAAQVCTLLSRPQGATVLEIRAATGWQAHSVRGFLSGSLRRQGRKLRSLRRNGERAYRLPA